MEVFCSCVWAFSVCYCRQHRNVLSVWMLHKLEFMSNVDTKPIYYRCRKILYLEQLLASYLGTIIH